MLTITDLSFSYPSRPLLKDLSFSLKEGQIGTLIGPSGCGKTTFLKIITGLLTPQQGQLSIAGHSAPQAFQKVAYMMQEEFMLPWRSVLNNLTLVGELGNKTLSKSALQKDALFYLSEMGLENWAHAYPDELSGGMRQRASLARALLLKRPLLLLDEPFAALDVNLREQLHTLLHHIRQKYGTTILMVTHDFRDALSLSDNIYLLANGNLSQSWSVDAANRHNPQLLQQFREALR